MPHLTLLASIAAAFLALAGPAHAGPFGDFETALRGAYADYRGALFQTNANHQEQAEKSLDSFRHKWSELAAANAAPPPQYVDDPHFRALSTVPGNSPP